MAQKINSWSFRDSIWLGRIVYVFASVEVFAREVQQHSSNKYILRSLEYSHRRQHRVNLGATPANLNRFIPPKGPLKLAGVTYPKEVSIN